MTSQPTPGEVLNGESVRLIDTDVEFHIFQDDEFCSGSTVRADAEHYAAVYGQDGPVERQTSINLSFAGFLSDDAIESVRAALASPAKATGWQEIEAHDNSATEVLVMAEGWSKPIVAWRHHPSSRTDIWLSTPGRYQVKPTHFHALPPRPEDEGAAS